MKRKHLLYLFTCYWNKANFFRLEKEERKILGQIQEIYGYKMGIKDFIVIACKILKAKQSKHEKTHIDDGISKWYQRQLKGEKRII